MITKEEANEAILESLAALNEEKELDDKIAISKDTVLLGENAELDSLDLIYVITNLENRLYDISKQEVQLTVDSDIFEGEHPFQNVSKLAEHIISIMKTDHN